MAQQQNIKVGDRVRIFGNAKGTCWETGIVSDLDKNGALINYGDRWFPIYGMGIREDILKLELLKV